MLFPAVRHEVSFWHGADRLVGDLVLPATAGPHPVLVLVGGRARPLRDRSAWLDQVADAGIAVLTWDRPGHGDSGGTPGPDEPGARAREVLAAVRRLDSLPEVDAAAVALVGVGTGGWAAAQAATFCGQIRALLLMCTPMVSGPDLVHHRFVYRTRAAGLDSDGAAAAGEALLRRLHALRTGLPAAELAAAERADRDRPWYPLLPAPGEIGGVGGPRVSADPRPTLSAVAAPVLALFGEQDPLTPLRESVRGVRRTLLEAGHRDHEVAVVRGADHALRVRPGHGLGAMIDGRHQFGDWPPGLTEYLTGWLAGRIRPTVTVPDFVPPGLLAPGPPSPNPVPSGPPAPSGPVSPGPVSSGPAPAGPALPRSVPVRQVRRRVAR